MPGVGEAGNLRTLIAQTEYRTTVAIQQAFNQAMRKGVAESVDLFVDALGKSIKNVSAGKAVLQQANYELAKMMQQSMLASYDQTVAAQKQFPSYRMDGEGINGTSTQPRESGGKLRNALARRDMIVATPQGIAYINEGELTKAAQHWGRLNFGAGSRSGRPAGQFEWQFDGQPLGVLSFDGPPSPAFRMPHGVFLEAGNSHGLPAGFYPLGRSANILTRGIAPRHFMDAGLARFTREFPAVYDRVLDTFITQGRQGEGPLPQVNVYADALYFLRNI